jgi:hypothetical protein
VTQVPQQPPPWVNGDDELAESRPLSSDRDERRLVAAAVRLLMRLPRVARYGLLALALAGGAELSGLDPIDLLFGEDAELEPDSVRKPNRSHLPDLRLERADKEALDVR